MKTHSLILVTALLLPLAGCLKTRAQLKDDDGAARPVAVQDVKPQGQYVIDELKSEITRITGRIEDVERAQQHAAKGDGGEAAIKKLETRIEELERAQVSMIDELKKLQAAPPKATDPEDHFESGKKAFEQGKFEDAAEAMGAYLKSKHPRAAETATYIRGESYFALKQYKKAIVEFARFPDKFTRSARMPAALLKIAQAFEALGEKSDARNFYQELVDKFPSSAEARRAKPKLKLR